MRRADATSGPACFWRCNRPQPLTRVFLFLAPTFRRRHVAGDGARGKEKVGPGKRLGRVGDRRLLSGITLPPFHLPDQGKLLPKSL